jgi:hypothetical protein
MIKKLLFSITSLTCSVTFTCVGQSVNSLKIELNSNPSSVIHLHKMIGPFPKNDESYFNIDVDQNGVVDFRITTEGYDAGSKKDYTITFEALDNSSFATETVNGHSLFTDSTNTPVDVAFPAQVVKMYNTNDVIYADECIESKRFLMSSFSCASYDGVHPSSQIVNSWISGIHYIGVKKVIDNNTYLGWIKLEVVSQQEVYLDSYTRMGSTAEPSDYSKGMEDCIYPNPTRSLLNIAVPTNKVDFYNAYGALIFSAENRLGVTPFILDLEGLSNGVYIAKIMQNGNEKAITRKIVKQ